MICTSIVGWVKGSWESRIFIAIIVLVVVALLALRSLYAWIVLGPLRLYFFRPDRSSLGSSRTAYARCRRERQKPSDAIDIRVVRVDKAQKPDAHRVLAASTGLETGMRRCYLTNSGVKLSPGTEGKASSTFGSARGGR